MSDPGGRSETPTVEPSPPLRYATLREGAAIRQRQGLRLTSPIDISGRSANSRGGLFLIDRLFRRLALHLEFLGPLGLGTGDPEDAVAQVQEFRAILDVEVELGV